jgi:hypothetical protein
MITPQTFRTTRPVTLTSKPSHSSQISRVFAAAIVNQQFCELLLQNPNQALRNGYFGETFSLSKEEQDLIVSIRAESLSDLARQVNRALSSQ